MADNISSNDNLGTDPLERLKNFFLLILEIILQSFVPIILTLGGIFLAIIAILFLISKALGF